MTYKLWKAVDGSILIKMDDGEITLEKNDIPSLINDLMVLCEVRRTNVKWTQDKIEVIKEKKQLGWSTKQIADYLGVPPKTLSHVFRRFHLTDPKLSKIARERKLRTIERKKNG